MHKINYFGFNWLIMKINNTDVARHLKYVKGVVYDLGCGIRPYEQDILKVSDRYIGIDWSNTLHGLNAEICADLNKPLPILDGVADTVVSFQVMEHLYEPQTMLNEAYRILKSNGNILLAVPFQWWVHEAPYDYFRYTRYGLEYMFTKAGFVDVQVDEATGFWSMWILKLNYQTIKLIRGPKPLRWIINCSLIPLWYFDQLFASILDKHWYAPQETAVYFVTARKR